MDSSLRDQQAQWREHNTRSNPASHGEFLDIERELGNLVLKTRPRILAYFSISLNGLPVSPDAFLPGQRLDGLIIIGAVSTLLGKEGLSAQGLWFGRDAPFDWYWASISHPLKIEVREDKRFRAGARCIWLTTSIAQYALTIPHPDYNDRWQSALAFFNAPHLDVWPTTGLRPDWWPAEQAGSWPGQKLPEELPVVVSREEDLQRLTEQLSMNPTSSLTSCHQAGPYTNPRLPCQPAHHLSQLQPWELKFDGGIKDKRSNSWSGGGEDPEQPQGRAEKRKKPNPNRRQVRWGNQ
ncbi:hypothetical protein RSOLAG22IIIB_10085 [Rhizoctonia solani]|uniref:Uncharacterized protein n=1 Tax=Rhizoctonia solani TaxID=456999 RepID=A0A0K6G0Q5_9AGAM|nr:hypothetical protein RSOLAG22IIIB_10085 [Rhizoctonia solani]